ncbi:MAG: 50S ribosomal protein L21 [Planctomycetota bacterium]|jgi:large subunit ribosomal protein L21|nr:50S ribosomal protein L21 [Planctomycetota bacterium]
MSTQAVIRTGGKQVLVSEGDVIDIELLAGQKDGDEVTFPEVLMLVDGNNSRIGAPLLTDVTVKAKILKEVKGEKTKAIFFRHRKDSMTTKGHRQHYHRVSITLVGA